MDYTIRLATNKDDAKDFFQLYENLRAKAFYEDSQSPIYIAGLNTYPQDFSEAWQWIQEKLVFIAVDTNQAILGFCVCTFLGNGRTADGVAQYLRNIQWLPEHKDFFGNPLNHPHIFFIDYLGVCERARGRKIGTQLEQHAIKTALDSGLTRFIGTVVTKPQLNKASFQMHKNDGWRDIGKMEKTFAIDRIPFLFGWNIIEAH